MKTIFRKLQLAVETKIADSQKQILAFGIFGVLNFPVFHFVWVRVSNHIYENLGLRLLAGFLCLGLVLKNYWPTKLKAFLPWYWYGTLLYCLPFFGTFMFLHNPESTIWETNGIFVIFLLILLVDSVSFLILFTLGLSLGYLAYYGITGVAYISLGQHAITFFNYVAAIIIGLVFAHNKEKLQKEKLKAASAVGASVAHELRTPLGAFKSSFNGIKEHLPALIRGYDMAKAAGLEVDEIRKDYYQSLQVALERTGGEVEYLQTIIDALLMNVKQKNGLVQHPLSVCSMGACIEEALERYPFKSPKQKSFIRWEKTVDFQFRGNKMLMVHVLFNLIKNAIQHVKSAGKAAIYISIDSKEKTNYLYFKDMGNGIPAHQLSKIFTRFFTTSINGTGLGLALCKTVLEEFGGHIKCESEEGHYTQFTLSFPKIVES